LAKNVGTELPLIEQTAAAHPDHPGLQELRLRAGIELGRLATATDALGKIAASDTAPAGFRARRATLEGMLAAARGDLLGATAKFDEAVAFVPKNVDARMGKLRTLLLGADVQPLLPEIKALADERPNDPEVKLLRVEVAIATGDGDGAIALLDELDKTLPDRPEVAYLRGQVFAMRSQLDEAKAAFAKALEKDPNFHAASLAEADMLAKARMVTEAVAVLDGALRRANEAGAEGPVQAKLLHAKARLLSRQGQSAAALVALDSALDVDPTNNDAQVLRGQLRLDAGRHEEGREDLVAVYERTGGYPGLAGPLGRIFVGEGKIDEATGLIGDAASNERAPADLKLVAARIELAKRNPEGAKQHASHVLAQDGANWEAHVVMAEAFLQSGDYPEALARINQAQPGTPQAELHLLKGKILEFNGTHEEVPAEYLRALKIDPALHEARFLYGRLLAYQGKAGPAKAELQRVVGATGDRFPEAWLNLGRAQRELGENDEAMKSLAKATQLDPTLHEGFYLEGRIHADRNKHGRAIELFEKSTAAEGTDEWLPQAWVSLGRAQVKAGQTAAAKASFRKFLEIAPANDPSRDEAERQLKAH
jgi:tetratricopeptide (TPR) repeat protein